MHAASTGEHRSVGDLAARMGLAVWGVGARPGEPAGRADGTAGDLVVWLGRRVRDPAEVGRSVVNASTGLGARVGDATATKDGGRTGDDALVEGVGGRVWHLTGSVAGRAGGATAMWVGTLDNVEEVRVGGEVGGEVGDAAWAGVGVWVG